MNATNTACHVPARDKSGVMTSLAAAMGAVALAFVIIRLVARWSVLGWDDACVGAAWLIGAAVSVLNVLMAQHGLGKDIWTIPVDQITNMLFLFYLTEPLYVTSTMLTKIGLCFFLLRIFPDRGFQITMWAIIGTGAATTVAFVFGLIFQCLPIRYFWLFYLGEMKGHCINRNAGSWVLAMVNIVLDLVILAAPLVKIQQLQKFYPTRKKLQIMFMFSVGAIVTIVSILRLRSLIVFMKSENFTYDNISIAEWSVVEIHVGILCACLPAARIFFGRIVPKALGVSVAGTKHGNASAYGDTLAQRPRPQSTLVDVRHFSHGSRDVKGNEGFIRLQERGTAQP